ncbi:MAG: DedA family protein [archaeon]
MFESIINWLTSLLYSLNYLGIFILMTIESSFIPFPSEVVMIPAGYLAASGKLNIFFVIVFGVLGSLLGAYVNYFLIGKIFGRSFIEKRGKFLFLEKKHLEKTENYFKKYGNSTTFFGRLVPVVRQYISIPAGFANMPLGKFSFYTALGASLWCTFLTLLGYYFGSDASNISQKANLIIILVVLAIGITIAIVHFIKNKKN